MKTPSERFTILTQTLPHPLLLGILGAAQILRWILIIVPPSTLNHPFFLTLTMMPWWGWVIAWILLLWAGSLNHALNHGKKFNKASGNFFEGFLNYLMKEGQLLYDHSAEGDFYSRINHWQRMVVEGLAIGLGAEASENYFHKMDSQFSLTRAFHEGEREGNSEALCRALQGNLEELEWIRKNLTAGRTLEIGEREDLKKTEPTPGNNLQLPGK